MVPDTKNSLKNYSKLVLNNQESLWEIAFEPNNGQKDNAGYWATYNGPLVDAPDAGSGAANQNFSDVLMLSSSYCLIGEIFMMTMMFVVM